jgi:hypothetical protein
VIKIKLQTKNLALSAEEQSVIKVLAEWQKIMNSVLITESVVYKQGMKDNQSNGPIARLQMKLIKLKFMSKASLGANQKYLGTYGPSTKRAVRNFQKKAFPNKRDEWNGQAGKNTLSALSGKVLASPSTSRSRSRGNHTSDRRDARQQRSRRRWQPSRESTIKIDLRDVNFLKKQLGSFSSINDGEMKQIHDIIAKYKKANLLNPLYIQYKKYTGDVLVKEIASISGVEKWKKPTLALMNKKYEKDLTSKVSEKTEGLRDTLRDIYGLMSPFFIIKAPLYALKEFKAGPPQFRIAFKFAAGSTTPFTERDLHEHEIKEISAFIEDMANPSKDMLSKAGKRYAKYFRLQAARLNKPGGEYSFGNRAFGCKAKKPKKCNNEFYAAMRRIDTAEGFQVNPGSTIGKLKNMMGQFSVINKGSYWLVYDSFDFNKWLALSNNPKAGFQDYYKKIFGALEGGKDQIVGANTKAGKKCAHNQQGGAKARAYNVARCWLPIRHAFLPGDKFPWETKAFSTYDGFKVILKIPKQSV